VLRGLLDYTADTSRSRLVLQVDEIRAFHRWVKRKAVEASECGTFAAIPGDGHRPTWMLHLRNEF
jgi:hypothetical protein